jgi:predicted DNA-binding protein with PD1-like motif
MQMRGLHIAIVLLALAPVSVVPAQSTDDYVSPSHSIAFGKAPRMRAQLISDQNGHKEYAVIFGKGDEAFSGLTEFAQKYNVTSGHFTAIGAIDHGTLAWFDRQRKMYKKIPVNQQAEVVSMIGDIGLYKGKPAVHTHMVVGLPDGTTIGGHVLEAYIFPTLEVMVTVDPVPLHKTLDPETDLSLFDPE